MMILKIYLCASALTIPVLFCGSVLAQEENINNNHSTVISPQVAEAAAGGGSVPIQIYLQVPDASLAVPNNGLEASRLAAEAATENFFSYLAEVIPNAPMMNLPLSQTNGSIDYTADIRINRTFEYNSIIAAEATEEGLQLLESLPNVVAIELDAPEQLYLSESVETIDAPLAWNIEGADGTGRTIAVLDTGIDNNHPAFEGRILTAEEACFRRDRKCPNGQSTMTGNGAASSKTLHGTHVAGIAVGNVKDYEGSRISGVAPGATLVPINVFSAEGSYPTDQIAAMEHVLNLRTRNSDPVAVVAVNISIGGHHPHAVACDTNEAGPGGRTESIRQLLSVGTATVVAAGNSGWDDAVSAPGCISDAITVSSVAKDATLWTGHNRSELTDLLGPGVRIVSAAPNSKYEVASGTSMAAPHVAGAIAVVSSAINSASINDVIEALINSGTHVVSPEQNSKEYKLINVAAAIRYLRDKQELVAKLDQVSSDDASLDNLVGAKVLDRSGLDIAIFEGVQNGDCILNLGFIETQISFVEVPCSSLTRSVTSDAIVSGLSGKAIFEISGFHNIVE